MKICLNRIITVITLSKNSLNEVIVMQSGLCLVRIYSSIQLLKTTVVNEREVLKTLGLKAVATELHDGNCTTRLTFMRS